MKKERPILFSDPMVRALLAGTKTQTRRVMNPQPVLHGCHWRWHDYTWIQGKRHPVDVYDLNPELASFGSLYGSLKPCPYGKPGDRLWVRETFSRHQMGEITYRSTYSGRFTPGMIRWIPSIHMPRAESRITLEVNHVRVERLHDITEADALAEGMAGLMRGTTRWESEARVLFREVWESIHGAASWEENPWIWRICFRRADPGSDTATERATQ